MNLHRMLQRRHADGHPVRVVPVGAGKFGSMFLSQVPHMPGLQVAAIADLSPQRAREAFLASLLPSNLLARRFKLLFQKPLCYCFALALDFPRLGISNSSRSEISLLRNLMLSHHKLSATCIAARYLEASNGEIRQAGQARSALPACEHG